MNNEIWELVGVILGDGNLWSEGRHYRIEITGDIKKDRDYFNNYLKNKFRKFTQNKISIKIRSRGLRLRINSKEFFNLLLQIGLHQRKEKIRKLNFLTKINKKQRILVLRGLVDTDGTVIKRSNGQTFIEISSKSKKLSNWMKKNLDQLGFRTFITKYTNKNNKTIYRVWLSGKENIQMWVNLIGFSNRYKLEKSLQILSN